MKIRITLVLVLIAAALGMAGTGHAIPTGDAVSDSGRYIVVLVRSASPRAVAAEHRAEVGAEVRHVYRHALSGYSARMSARDAARVAHDPRVMFVQPDRTVSVAGQGKPTGIRRIDAEISPTAKIDRIDERVNVDVAVIDTGIDLDHPDLNVHTAGAKNCTSGPTADDGNGHGTHVAGTIGAVDNTIGVVGVAPGARVWPVRVLNNSGSGTWSSVICGVDYVTANASSIEVANMSLGGSGSDDGACGAKQGDALHRAICGSVAKGVTYAVAAGNKYDDARDYVPAAYDEVITVSALADFNGRPGGGASPKCRSDVDDTFADFSNFGSEIDVIAPGVCIRSTWRGGKYKRISGTSMATPHVAGAAALNKVTHPSATPDSIKTALQSAGNTGYIWPDTDPDGIQEKLLNVATF